MQLAWTLLNDANGMELASSRTRFYLALDMFSSDVVDCNSRSRLGIVLHAMGSGEILVEIATKWLYSWSGIPFYLYGEIAKGLDDDSWLVGGAASLPDGRGAFRTTREVLTEKFKILHLTEKSLSKLPLTRFLQEHGTWTCIAARNPHIRLSYDDCSNVEVAVVHYDPLIKGHCAEYTRAIESYRNSVKSSRRHMEEIEAGIIQDAERAADALNMLSDKYGIELDVDANPKEDYDPLARHWCFEQAEIPGFVATGANYYTQNIYLCQLVLVLYGLKTGNAKTIMCELYWLSYDHVAVKRIGTEVLDCLGIPHETVEGHAVFKDFAAAMEVLNENEAEICAAAIWGDRIKGRDEAREVAMAVNDVAMFKANEDGSGPKMHSLKSAKTRVAQNMNAIHSVEAEMRRIVELHENAKATLMKAGLIDD